MTRHRHHGLVETEPWSDHVATSISLQISDVRIFGSPKCHWTVITGWWFQPTPLKNMSWSVGMIIPFPI